MLSLDVLPGNPLACAVAIAALDVLVDEKLPERAERLGEIFKKDLETLKSVGADGNGEGGWVKAIRCKGLFSAIDIDSEKQKQIGRSAWDLCLLMASKGVLAKPTHENTYVYTFLLIHYFFHVDFDYTLLTLIVFFSPISLSDYSDK